MHAVKGLCVEDTDEYIFVEDLSVKTTYFRMHRKNVPNNVRMGQMNALSSVNNLSDSEKKKI